MAKVHGNTKVKTLRKMGIPGKAEAREHACRANQTEEETLESYSRFDKYRPRSC